MVAEARLTRGPSRTHWVDSQEENRQEKGHDCEIAVTHFLQQDCAPERFYSLPKQHHRVFRHTSLWGIISIQTQPR